jgi:hypothetical protein
MYFPLILAFVMALIFADMGSAGDYESSDYWWDML